MARSVYSSSAPRPATDFRPASLPRSARMLRPSAFLSSVLAQKTALPPPVGIIPVRSNSKPPPPVFMLAHSMATPFRMRSKRRSSLRSKPTSAKSIWSFTASLHLAAPTRKRAKFTSPCSSPSVKATPTKISTPPPASSMKSPSSLRPTMTSRKPSPSWAGKIGKCGPMRY